MLENTAATYAAVRAECTQTPKQVYVYQSDPELVEIRDSLLQYLHGLLLTTENETLIDRTLDQFYRTGMLAETLKRLEIVVKSL